LTDYRDCIIYNAPIDFGLGTGSMQKLDGGVWSVLMRIPDNPEVKSRAAFTFAKGLDALTYGWELTNEIVRVATAIMKVISGARRGRHVAAGNRIDLTFRHGTGRPFHIAHAGVETAAETRSGRTV
jgi:hypothetical protein